MFDAQRDLQRTFDCPILVNSPFVVARGVLFMMESVKYLDLHIQNYSKWNVHVDWLISRFLYAL